MDNIDRLIKIFELISNKECFNVPSMMQEAYLKNNSIPGESSSWFNPN